MINALTFFICIYIYACVVYIFLVKILLSRLQYRSNSASQNQNTGNTANTLQFPLYRNDGYHEADCLHGWTIMDIARRLRHEFRLTVWLRAQIRSG